MKPHPVLERGVYALIVVLSIIALLLVLNSRADMLDARVVYQGF